MKINDIADGIVEHKEAGGLFNGVAGFVNVNKIEDGCKNLVHPLDVLDSGVQAGINIENSRHVVVSVGFALFLLAANELFVPLLALSVYQFELLSSCACQVGDHYGGAFSCKEGKLCVGPWCVFFYLLPQDIIFFKFFKSWMVFFKSERVVFKFLFR